MKDKFTCLELDVRFSALKISKNIQKIFKKYQTNNKNKLLPLFVFVIEN